MGTIEALNAHSTPTTNNKNTSNLPLNKNIHHCQPGLINILVLAIMWFYIAFDKINWTPGDHMRVITWPSFQRTHVKHPSRFLELRTRIDKPYRLQYFHDAKWYKTAVHTSPQTGWDITWDSVLMHNEIQYISRLYVFASSYCCTRKRIYRRQTLAMQ